MSASFTKEEFARLVKRLASTDDSNLRVGSTPPFPSLANLRALTSLDSCGIRFSTVYQLPVFLSHAGASGGDIFMLTPVNERQRIERLQGAIERLPLLVKKTQLGTVMDDENFMDIVIGSRLNILVAAKIAPGFMRTVDWFVCQELGTVVEPSLYTVVERQDVNIVDFLLNSAPRLELNRSILAQLLFTLESAQASIGYVHYDLHAGNVFATVARNKAQLKADTWMYIRPNGLIMFVPAKDSNRHETVIIDFGRNRIQSPLFTKTGRFRTGRAAGTEVLVVNGHSRVGVMQNFNRQWDMRRFSTYLIEQLVRRPSRAAPRPTTSLTPPSISGPVDAGEVDYLRRLHAASDAKLYEQFIDALNAMSGHRHVKLHREIPSTDRLRDTWEFYFKELVKNPYQAYPYLTISEVDDLLDAFRRGGVLQLAAWRRTGNRKALDVVLYMWAWTMFTFEETPGSVLDMPFFEPLFNLPTRADLVVWEVAKFRQLVEVAEGTRVGCASRSCSELAVYECGQCRAIGYCSESCADADAQVHQAHCRLHTTD